MSHIDQTNFIKKFKEFYINKNFNKDISILEIGSLDVNGSIRNLFDFASEYIGIDLEKGPNVDLILNGTDIDKLNKSFDIIISCECFEHAKDWKEIFDKMCQISKPNSLKSTQNAIEIETKSTTVSYKHLRAHETPDHLVCRRVL